MRVDRWPRSKPVAALSPPKDNTQLQQAHFPTNWNRPWGGGVSVLFVPGFFFLVLKVEQQKVFS